MLALIGYALHHNSVPTHPQRRKTRAKKIFRRDTVPQQRSKAQTQKLATPSFGNNFIQLAKLCKSFFDRKVTKGQNNRFKWRTWAKTPINTFASHFSVLETSIPEDIETQPPPKSWWKPWVQEGALQALRAIYRHPLTFRALGYSTTIAQKFSTRLARSLYPEFEREKKELAKTLKNNGITIPNAENLSPKDLLDKIDKMREIPNIRPSNLKNVLIGRKRVLETNPQIRRAILNFRKNFLLIDNALPVCNLTLQFLADSTDSQLGNALNDIAKETITNSSTPDPNRVIARILEALVQLDPTPIDKTIHSAGTDLQKSMAALALLVLPFAFGNPTATSQPKLSDEQKKLAHKNKEATRGALQDGLNHLIECTEKSISNIQGNKKRASVVKEFLNELCDPIIEIAVEEMDLNNFFIETKPPESNNLAAGFAHSVFETIDSQCISKDTITDCMTNASTMIKIFYTSFAPILTKMAYQEIDAQKRRQKRCQKRCQKFQDEICGEFAELNKNIAEQEQRIKEYPRGSTQQLGQHLETLIDEESQALMQEAKRSTQQLDKKLQELMQETKLPTQQLDKKLQTLMQEAKRYTQQLGQHLETLIDEELPALIQEAKKDTQRLNERLQELMQESDAFTAREYPLYLLAKDLDIKEQDLRLLFDHLAAFIPNIGAALVQVFEETPENFDKFYEGAKQIIEDCVGKQRQPTAHEALSMLNKILGH